ncbi:MAG TPA: dTDP-glucose 4,6-dehydratase [Longimicrobiales bacterium]|nr:dTDP-glucose 4,6-dehydratase [Longimicrobiales bacterium]
MPSLLVTGGAGFIGANFARYWSRRHSGDPIVVLDALTYAGRRSRIADLERSGAVRFVEGDIRDQALVERLLVEGGIDTVVHFAAESHVDRSIGDPDAFVSTNVVGTQSLLEAGRRVWLEGSSGAPHRFHHVSTDEVFGSLAEGAAATEASPYAPNSPYAASKAASDHLVRAYHRTFGLRTTTTHCTNNYGPWQFPEKLVALFLANILRGRPLPVYGDGQHVRDWLHVEDHCRALELVLTGGRPGTTFVVGGEGGPTNLEVVEALCRAVDRALEADPARLERFPGTPRASGGRAMDLIRFVEDRPGHDRRYAVDASRIREHLGFRPERSLDEGLGATVDWYLDHEDWWGPLLEGAGAAG